MNKIIRSIISHFRCWPVRRYLVVLPDHNQIRKQLKLEDLRTDRAFLDMHSHELSIQQKRVEGQLTDLTRCIRGMEFDVKVNANLENKGKKQGSGSDKKSSKVGDFSE
ncbi:uncharacterized protein LOC108087672 [Drosophila ficusphila]|uniref:uncharacterized protein LOC108087672 n=1 Tax=Drosophila ficusphila TaxID=30025 RepID=UPI0007E84926|nr:uncharacterized protein LOC108087672 [Drosophila ficusphila]